MSFVNVLDEMWNGVGFTATSVPQGILYTPNSDAVGGKAMVLGILSGDPTGLAAVSATYLSGCIMLNTQHAVKVNAQTMASAVWVKIST